MGNNLGVPTKTKRRRKYKYDSYTSTYQVKNVLCKSCQASYQQISFEQGNNNSSSLQDLAATTKQKRERFIKLSDEVYQLAKIRDFVLKKKRDEENKEVMILEQERKSSPPDEPVIREDSESNSKSDETFDFNFRGSDKGSFERLGVLSSNPRVNKRLLVQRREVPEFDDDGEIIQVRSSRFITNFDWDYDSHSSEVNGKVGSNENSSECSSFTEVHTESVESFPIATYHNPCSFGQLTINSEENIFLDSGVQYSMPDCCSEDDFEDDLGHQGITPYSYIDDSSSDADTYSKEIDEEIKPKVSRNKLNIIQFSTPQGWEDYINDEDDYIEEESLVGGKRKLETIIEVRESEELIDELPLLQNSSPKTKFPKIVIEYASNNFETDSQCNEEDKMEQSEQVYSNAALDQFPSETKSSKSPNESTSSDSETVSRCDEEVKADYLSEKLRMINSSMEGSHMFKKMHKDVEKDKDDYILGIIEESDELEESEQEISDNTLGHFHSDAKCPKNFDKLTSSDSETDSQYNEEDEVSSKKMLMMHINKNGNNDEKNEGYCKINADRESISKESKPDISDIVLNNPIEYVSTSDYKTDSQLNVENGVDCISEKLEFTDADVEGYRMLEKMHMDEQKNENICRVEARKVNKEPIPEESEHLTSDIVVNNLHLKTVCSSTLSWSVSDSNSETTVFQCDKESEVNNFSEKLTDANSEGYHMLEKRKVDYEKDDCILEKIKLINESLSKVSKQDTYDYALVNFPTEVRCPENSSESTCSDSENYSQCNEVMEADMLEEMNMEDKKGEVDEIFEDIKLYEKVFHDSSYLDTIGKNNLNEAMLDESEKLKLASAKEGRNLILEKLHMDDGRCILENIMLNNKLSEDSEKIIPDLVSEIECSKILIEPAKDSEINFQYNSLNEEDCHSEKASDIKKQGYFIIEKLHMDDGVCILEKTKLNNESLPKESTQNISDLTLDELHPETKWAKNPNELADSDFESGVQSSKRAEFGCILEKMWVTKENE